MVKQKQNSGINLLRIIMMLQIVYGHCMLYGGIKDKILDTGGVQELVYRFLYFSTRCPVFVLIALSGYFLIDRDEMFEYSRKKIFSSWKVMLFYSVLIGGILQAVWTGMSSDAGMMSLLKIMVKSLLPFSTSTWYYMTNYIIVLFLAPYVNMVLKKITRKQYLVLITGAFIILSLYPLVANTVGIVGELVDHREGKSALDFLLMYCVGGYLKLYYDEKKFNKGILIGIFIICAVANEGLFYLFDFYQTVSGYNDNPLAVVQVICLILFFKDMKFSSGIVDKISRGNIGVYLISEQPFARNVIWGMLSAELLYSSNIIFMYAKVGVAVFAVYSVCWTVEIMRKRCSRKIGSPVIFGV